MLSEGKRSSGIKKEDLLLPIDVIGKYLEFTKLRYEQETAHPKSLNAKISIYITITVLILGALSSVFKDFLIGASIIYLIYYLFFWS